MRALRRGGGPARRARPGPCALLRSGRRPERPGPPPLPDPTAAGRRGAARPPVRGAGRLGADRRRRPCGPVGGDALAGPLPRARRRRPPGPGRGRWGSVGAVGGPVVRRGPGWGRRGPGREGRAPGSRRECDRRRPGASEDRCRRPVRVGARRRGPQRHPPAPGRGPGGGPGGRRGRGRRPRAAAGGPQPRRRAPAGPRSRSALHRPRGGAARGRAGDGGGDGAGGPGRSAGDCAAPGRPHRTAARRGAADLSDPTPSPSGPAPAPTDPSRTRPARSPGAAAAAARARRRRAGPLRRPR